MLLVLIVALVVVGPKDLPRLMRKMGQWTSKARGMADQFRRSFDEMARQSELDELRKEIDELRNARPLAGVEREMNEALHAPAVSIAPETETETAKTEPDHGEPAPESAEPSEPPPPTEQRPPP